MTNIEEELSRNRNIIYRTVDRTVGGVWNFLTEPPSWFHPSMKHEKQYLRSSWPMLMSSAMTETLSLHALAQGDPARSIVLTSMSIATLIAGGLSYFRSIFEARELS